MVDRMSESLVNFSQILKKCLTRPDDGGIGAGSLGKCHIFPGGGLCKFFRFCKFLVTPFCMSKIFLIPLRYCKISVIPHLIIKATESVSVFEADIDHPLGLLKVKAGNLRGTFIVVRVSFTQLTRNLADNFPSYLHISVAMGNRLPWQQRYISISQLSEGVEGPDLV